MKKRTYKKLSIAEVINLAKVMAYKNIHIPKNLRGKIEIKVTSNRVIIAKKKK